MPADSAAQQDPTAADLRNRVFVTGAGFSKALVPNAPLLVDDFGNDDLAKSISGLPNASRLFEWERDQHEQGHIDIERLMTRVESLMPYDYADFAGNAANEYGFLLSELKRSFLERIRKAGKGEIHREALDKFARHCVGGRIPCITFNYDDFLDRALMATSQWRPDHGYGFRCQNSVDTVAGFGESYAAWGIPLLKLHGSINWRPKLGQTGRVPIDAITHHEDWSPMAGEEFPDVDNHLEPQPVMVPPVLSKSSLVEQPVLRLVWSQAFKLLESAHEVTFLGYSLPMTDVAARTLFSEALVDLPLQDIHVVNLPKSDKEIDKLRTAYRSVFRDLPDAQFRFEDALAWIRRLPD